MEHEVTKNTKITKPTATRRRAAAASVVRWEFNNAQRSRVRH